MTRSEAEDYVYKSFLEASRYQEYDVKDKEKRNPQLTRKILRDKSSTPAVVVTGSKGKGSISNMISQILQTQMKVGLMTSPHLVNFCERFKVNGTCISDTDFVKYIECVKLEFDMIESTIMESQYISPMGIQAAVSLNYFLAQRTDYNVFECGKGAQYDDVNNIKHDYAVIGSVFLEHTRELGDTLEKIAEDKAHVINGEQKCVYVAEQEECVLRALRKRAHKYDVPLKTYGVDFQALNVRYASQGMVFDVKIENEIFTNISIPLMGEHQAKNCAIAMAICKDILETFDIDAIKENLMRLDWPGRMEVLCVQPFIMLDACINRASCEHVKAVLRHMSFEKCTLIVGIPDDKDYSGVVEAMKYHTSCILLTKSQNSHYVFTEKQRDVLKQIGISAIWTNSIEEAVKIAKLREEPILILGTTSLIAEVKKLQEKDGI